MFLFIFSNKIFIKIPLINSLGSFHLWRLGRSCCKPKPFQAQPNYHHQTNIQQITHTHTHTHTKQYRRQRPNNTHPLHFGESQSTWKRLHWSGRDISSCVAVAWISWCFKGILHTLQIKIWNQFFRCVYLYCLHTHSFITMKGLANGGTN